MQPDPTVSVEDVIQLAREKWKNASYIRVQPPEIEWSTDDGEIDTGQFFMEVYVPEFTDGEGHRPVFDEMAPSLTALAAAIKETK